MVEEKHGRWFHSSITRWGCCVLDTALRSGVLGTGVYGGVLVATAADGRRAPDEDNDEV